MIPPLTLELPRTRYPEVLDAKFALPVNCGMITVSRPSPLMGLSPNGLQRNEPKNFCTRHRRATAGPFCLRFQN